MFREPTPPGPQGPRARYLDLDLGLSSALVYTCSPQTAPSVAPLVHTDFGLEKASRFLFLTEGPRHAVARGNPISLLTLLPWAQTSPIKPGNRAGPETVVQKLPPGNPQPRRHSLS